MPWRGFKKKQLFNKDFDDNFLILSNIQDPTANDIPSLVSEILATSEYQLCSQNNRFNVS